MHFCVSATRGGIHIGFCWPRKIGTNWFMPALVKSRFGASGNSDEDGITVCCFDAKKSRKLWRISFEVIAFESTQAGTPVPLFTPPPRRSSSVWARHPQSSGARRRQLRRRSSDFPEENPSPIRGPDRFVARQMRATNLFGPAYRDPRPRR